MGGEQARNKLTAIAKTAFSAANRTSHAHAMSMARPRHMPCRAAMTGTRHVERDEMAA